MEFFGEVHEADQSAVHNQSSVSGLEPQTGGGSEPDWIWEPPDLMQS
jgi:hypothetical protein